MSAEHTLGHHFDRFVDDLVQSGRYASAGEVVRDGLRLLEDREKAHAALRRAIEEGLQSGPSEPWDADEIKQAGRRMESGEADSGLHG